MPHDIPPTLTTMADELSLYRLLEIDIARALATATRLRDTTGSAEAHTLARQLRQAAQTAAAARSWLAAQVQP